MATAVVSGTEAVMVMITALSHERNVEVDVSRHQALVCVASNLFIYTHHSVQQQLQQR